jgi:hypothetical protein
VKIKLEETEHLVMKKNRNIQLAAKITERKYRNIEDRKVQEVRRLEDH